MNGTGKPLMIPQITSHMHQRGVRFDAWHSDGTPYDNSDWAHPRVLNLEPPLALAPGDYIEYQCTHTTACRARNACAATRRSTRTARWATPSR